MNKNSEITGQLVQFATTNHLKDIPNSTKRLLRLSVVDWIAVAVAGRNEPVSKLIRELEKETGGSSESVVIGLENRLPSRSAAYANGVAGHSLDYDDTHFASFGHPSAVIVPASLAISDKIKANTEKFYDATLIGIELTIRIGIWLGKKHYTKGFHITGTAGAFGAAMAVSHILDLNTEQAKNAIGIVASRASGIRAQFGTMGKPFQAGIAASSGVEAALLAKKGFVSASNALEEPLGFGATHDSDFCQKAFAGLGKSFTFENITHKFHASCHGTHATIEALLAMLKENTIMPEDIEKIYLKVNPRYLDICNIEKPKTGLQAKFSFKLMVALVVSGYDTTSLETFSDTICQKSSLVEIAERVSVSSDLAITETAAKVTLQTYSGKIFSSQYDLGQDFPIEMRERKIREKTNTLIGNSLGKSLWQEVGLGSQLPSSWIENNFNLI